MNKEQLISDLKFLFNSVLKNEKIFMFGKRIIDNSPENFIIVDKTSNPARIYLYVRNGNQLSQIMLHNWKGTIWSTSILVGENSIKNLEPKASAWDFLKDGLFIIEGKDT